MTEYPLKLEISGSVLEKWQQAERPSWNDHDRSEDHVYSILDRYKTRVEIRNKEELKTVADSLEYWKESMKQMTTRSDQTGYALERFADKLVEEANQE